MRLTRLATVMLVSTCLTLAPFRPPDDSSASGVAVLHPERSSLSELAPWSSEYGRAALECLFAARPDILPIYDMRGESTAPGNYPFIAYNWFANLKIKRIPGDDPALVYPSLEQYLAALGCDIPAQNMPVTVQGDQGPQPSPFLSVSDTGDIFSSVANWRLGGFRWVSASGQLRTPRLMAWDRLDPPDIGLRREGDLSGGNPVALRSGQNLGTIYWQPLVDQTFPGGGNGRSSQIYTLLAGDPTATSVAANLHFATTPPGSTTPADALVLTETGRTQLQSRGDPKAPALSFGREPTGLFQGSSGEASVSIGGQEALRMSPPTTNETAAWLLTNRDGNAEIQRVLVGPPDSGGSGYRALRVTN